MPHSPLVALTSIRRVLIVAFAMGLLVAAAPCSASELDAARLTTEAERYLRAGERYAEGDAQLEQYARAEQLAERALKLAPDNPESNFIYFAARGRRLLATGSVVSALRAGTVTSYLTRAIELDPNYANALAAKGGILLDLPFYLGGNAKEALDYLSRAVTLNPTGPGTRITYAKALIRLGDPAAARENLTLAAHHACVTRRADVLATATTLLGELPN
jgi:tetratricopeptide (TPR) repeat protein